MAYIGNSPANTGNYQLVDDIASSFNGTLVSFALASGGTAITPAKSGQILANINGVMQEPDDGGTNGFKVVSSNIVFSSAPASGDTFWAVYQGQNVDIGTPSDDVVDTAHIKDDAVTAAKLANAINTDIATGVTGNTTANAALPKAGGAMTGTITNLRSTGIDDNANALAMTIDSSEQVGIGVTTVTAKLDISEATRTGTHPTGVKGLYVTGDFGSNAGGAEFRHSNSTQGVGIGYSGIYKVDSSTDSNLLLTPQGAGDVIVENGNLVIGTSGKGIDFSANSHASGMSSELLDSYETGTWTPAIAAYSGTNPTVSANVSGTYTRIGRFVTTTAYLQNVAVTGTKTGITKITGLPFTPVRAGTGSWTGSVITMARSHSEPFGLGSDIGFLSSNNGAAWSWESNNIFPTGSGEMRINYTYSISKLMKTTKQHLNYSKWILRTDI